MLYNKRFSDTLFKNPPAQYRGAPFWAWNTKLDTATIKEQMGQFLEMGMGGFFIHVRVGLDTEYLGKEFMNQVKECMKEAKKKGIYSWLYDEDRWPSGYGGGSVTKDHQYRSKFLVITPFEDYRSRVRQQKFGANGSGDITGTGDFLTAYYIKLDKEGCLEDYEQCRQEAGIKTGYQKWYVYMETSPNSPWFNNQSYVDTLNPKATQAFIAETHEKYKRTIGEEFGLGVPGIFTDEPQFVHKQTLPYAESQKELVMPFTIGFDKVFFEETGISLLEHLPQLIWDLPQNQISVIRYHYHRLILERFATACADQMGDWCEKNGLILTGHMMEEPTLFSQSHALGEVMRNLQAFTIPGIDMLCDQREYMTAKQAQSVAHQCGREGVMCEVYGVTNWNFDLRHHKLQGDWLAALGVTLRVHHLTLMSMAGESKRDFPASIGMQSPWYKKYYLIEDHFARVNTALTQGEPIVRIGVIHPVESYWLLMGPNKQTSAKREQLDEQFQEVTENLLFSLQDFDFVSEAMIPDMRDGIKIGKMEYDVIVIPRMITLRKTTLKFLRDYRKAGREVIFLGEPGGYVDAEESEEVYEFAKKCTQIAFNKAELVEALEAYRMIDVWYDGELRMKKPLHFKNWGGERTREYLYQMRKDEDGFWLYLANGKKVQNPDLTESRKLRLQIFGEFQAVLYNTLDGTQKNLNTTYKDGRTELCLKAYAHDSFLIRLEDKQAIQPVETENGKKNNDICEKEIPLWKYPTSVKREEKNVAVLDMAEYALDDEKWNPKEEVLRLDNFLRKRLGWPLRREAFAQPWMDKENKSYGHRLRLRYTFEIQDIVPEIEIAFENLDKMTVYVNGSKKKVCLNGYYVDAAIKKGSVCGFQIGENELLLELPYEKKINIEVGYLLGEFAVRVHGTKIALLLEQKEFAYGSIVNFGMPFYGGNLSYIQEIYLEEGIYEMEVSRYRGSLTELFVDGISMGEIIFAPYRKQFSVTESKVYMIEIKCFGTRINTFGSFHNCNETEVYFSPDAWRTTEDSWSYEYQWKEVGILKAPVLRKIR